jgi:hypothetical protein
MRYREILERDDSKVIEKLRALIDHPSTESTIRAAAQQQLARLTLRSKSGVDTSTDGMIYNRHGRMQNPGLRTQKKF